MRSAVSGIPVLFSRYDDVRGVAVLEPEAGN